MEQLPGNKQSEQFRENIQPWMNEWMRRTTEVEEKAVHKADEKIEKVKKVQFNASNVVTSIEKDNNHKQLLDKEVGKILNNPKDLSYLASSVGLSADELKKVQDRLDESIVLKNKALEKISEAEKFAEELKASSKKENKIIFMDLEAVWCHWCHVMDKTTYEDKEVKDIITIDGLRVVFEDGWGLVRASNTTPVIVTRFEAKTPESLNRIKTLLMKKLDEIRG